MHLLVDDYLPNDDKTKNVFVKQERGETELVRGYAVQGVRRRSQDKTQTISKT